MGWTSGRPTTAGLGVLIGPGQVVTCAHVVNTALGRGQREQAPPATSDFVQVDFPLMANTPVRSAHVAAWAPPSPNGSGGGDVAGLVLGETAPPEAAPARFLPSMPAPGARLRVYGYPGEPPRPAGAWVELDLKGSVGGQLIQVESRVYQTVKAQPGYSGSPVWHDESGEVVGLLQATGGFADQPDRDAYLLPGTVVASAWEDLFDYLLIPPNPYRGLEPFTARDASYFFGRDEDIAKLAARVRSQPVTMVVGPSGVGKSSLVRAGLVPRLREDNPWSVALVRPGQDPWHRLAAGLLQARRLGQASDSGAGEAGGESLDEVAAEIERLRREGLGSTARFLRSAGRPLLVIVDQFEELLATGQPPDPELLDLLLPPAGSEEGACRLVLTARTDFLWDVPGLAARLDQRLYPLSALRAPQLRQAIERPATALGVTFEDGLVEQLVRDTQSGALPLLQFTLTRLWDTQRRNTLTFTGYQSMGGVSGALDRFADQQLHEFADLSDEVVDRVLLCLVRGATDQADRATRERVYRRGLPEPQWAALSHLAQARLVITDTDSTGEPYAELAHEALIQSWGRLHRIVGESADFLSWLSGIQRRAADQDPIPEDRIAEARRWLDTRPHDIPPAVKAFIDNSQTAAEARLRELNTARHRAVRAARRARALLGMLLALVVVLAATSVYALDSKRTANQQRDLAVAAKRGADQQRDIAISQQLINRSETLRDTEPRIAKLESLAAWSIHHSPDARYAMLAAATAPGIATLTGHTDRISTVAFGRDGKTLASAGGDGTVRLWDVASRRPLGDPLIGHIGFMSSVAFSPDRKTLVTGGDRHGTLRLWDVVSRRSLGGPFNGDTRGVDSVAFSPDGKTLASGGGTDAGDGTVQLWDVRTRRPLDGPLTVARSDNIVGAAMAVWVAFSPPDGKVLASGDSDGRLRLWDVATRQPLGGPLTGATGFKSSVAFSADGQILAFGALGMVRLWDVATRRPLPGLSTGDTGLVNSVAFSPDGKILASGDSDGRLRLWDVASRRQVGGPLTGGDTDSVESLAFSPDGKTLASGEGGGRLRLWDVSVALGRRLGDPLTVDNGSVNSVAFSPDGKTLASGSVAYGGDGMVGLWEVASRRQTRSWLSGDHNGGVFSVAFSPDGRILASGGSGDTGGESGGGMVRLWEVSTGRPIRRLLTGSTGASAVTFSPDGKSLASGGGRVLLWEVSTGRPMGRPLTGSTGGVTSVAFSPDGKILASAEDNGGIRLWDVARQRQIGGSLSNHTDFVSSVAFSPDGKILASAEGDGSIRLWDVAGRRQIGGPLNGHAGPVNTVAFSPDGKTLAGGNADGTLRLLDVASRRQIGSLLTHEVPLSKVAFSPDRKTMVSASDGGTVRLWDVAYTVDPVPYLCRSTGGSFTRDEWRTYVSPDLAYRNVCP